MQILEILARVQPVEAEAHFPQSVRHEAVSLAWGATVIVITSHQSAELAQTLLLLKRSGLRVTLVLVDPPRVYRSAREVVGQDLELPIFKIRQEKDIEVWSPVR